MCDGGQQYVQPLLNVKFSNGWTYCWSSRQARSSCSQSSTIHTLALEGPSRAFFESESVNCSSVPGVFPLLLMADLTETASFGDEDSTRRVSHQIAGAECRRFVLVTSNGTEFSPQLRISPIARLLDPVPPMRAVLHRIGLRGMLLRIWVYGNGSTPSHILFEKRMN